MSEPLVTAQYAAQLTDCQSRLYAYIASLMGDREQAMDVLQETNRILLEKAAAFEPGSNFIAWAFAIARFEVLKAARIAGKRSGMKFDLDLVEQLADESAAAAESLDAEMRALAGCLEKLPAESRALITARYEQGSSVASLAAERNQKPNTTAKALHRIRLQLLECIQRRLARADDGGDA